MMLGFDSVRAYCAKSILDAYLRYYEKSLILFQLDWNSDNVSNIDNKILDFSAMA